MAYLRPSNPIRLLNRLLVLAGITDAVRVAGRKSGRKRALAVNVLRHGDRRYLVAPRGTTQWVRNLRASGEADIRVRGRWTTVRARELPVEARQPLIDEYLRRWGWQVGSQFKALPDDADHPVFELEREAQ